MDRESDILEEVRRLKDPVLTGVYGSIEQIKREYKIEDIDVRLDIELKHFEKEILNLAKYNDYHLRLKKGKELVKFVNTFIKKKYSHRNLKPKKRK